METYLSSARKQFQYYKSLGEKTFEQLPEEAFFRAISPESNSIAIIVQHLHGNMLSRWTDFLKSDGEKEWRKRDLEFERVVTAKEEMLRLWEEGWACLFATINTLTEKELNETIYIRNQGMTVTDAINRQLCHYSYHVGQIVFAGKILVERNWKSLSIPKNQSTAYNAEKFSEQKGMRHFTDEYLKKKD